MAISPLIWAITIVSLLLTRLISSPVSITETVSIHVVIYEPYSLGFRVFTVPSARSKPV